MFLSDPAVVTPDEKSGVFGLVLYRMSVPNTVTIRTTVVEIFYSAPTYLTDITFLRVRQQQFTRVLPNQKVQQHKKNTVTEKCN